MLKKMCLSMILVCMIGLLLLSCKQEINIDSDKGTFYTPIEFDYKNIRNAIDSDGGTFYAPIKFVFEVSDMNKFKQEKEYVRLLLSKAFPRGISDFKYSTEDSTTYVEIKTKIPVYVDDFNTWIKESKNSLFSLSHFDNVLFLDMNREKYKKFKKEWKNHFTFQSEIDITKMIVYIYVKNTTEQKPKIRIQPNFIDGEAKVYPKKQKLEPNKYVTIMMSDVSLYYLRKKGQVEIMSFEEK